MEPKPSSPSWCAKRSIGTWSFPWEYDNGVHLLADANVTLHDVLERECRKLRWLLYPLWCFRLGARPWSLSCVGPTPSAPSSHAQRFFGAWLCLLRTHHWGTKSCGCQRQTPSWNKSWIPLGHVQIKFGRSIISAKRTHSAQQWWCDRLGERRLWDRTTLPRNGSVRRPYHEQSPSLRRQRGSTLTLVNLTKSKNSLKFETLAHRQSATLRPEKRFLWVIWKLCNISSTTCGTGTSVICTNALRTRSFIIRDLDTTMVRRSAVAHVNSPARSEALATHVQDAPPGTRGWRQGTKKSWRRRQGRVAYFRRSRRRSSGTVLTSPPRFSNAPRSRRNPRVPARRLQGNQEHSRHKICKKKNTHH